MNMPLAIEHAVEWQTGVKAVRCLGIVDETPDVKTFSFGLKGDESLEFKPGQFLNMTFTIGSQDVQRCYSIASSPNRPRQFAITVKRVPDGKVSNWLHDSFGVGHEVRIGLATGHFNCVDIEADKYLLLSGGSGITPGMSMVRWMLESGQQRDLHFIHSARSPVDIIFHDELLSIDRQWPGFQLSLLCEHKSSARGWGGFRGRLSADLLQAICPDFLERRVFCCGPAPYMQAVRRVLEALDYPMDRYVEESFGGAPLTPGSASPVPGEATVSTQVNFARMGTQGCGNFSQSLLDTALNSGVWIQSACRTGICGSCKVLKLEGSVSMDAALALSEAEVSGGYVLACCAYPQGDVTLDL
ncbi:hypothetical protein A8C75_16595 [Marinobacterium aestuarii]|uniref:Hybrid-cluster NAD(P)-dependent oxidoreductase n=1 Tax=Marinobacterium aestuarii TaxID=1821621 RepID=A0A1A9F2D9_9GAMM|nr:hybrid-cluster NAD(P)-dependent oxidoreductase [Marinobacterium aestuarii]ANG63929.1 hypothetical protein A8C75_16595 [Marinobacterium aestuarii]